MSSNPQQAIPSVTQQLVSTPGGQITTAWYRFLLTLWNRTGGTTGNISGLPVIVNAPVGTLLTATALNASVLVRSGPTGNFIDSVDTAKNYISAHSFPVSPSTSNNLFINTTAFSWTITPVNNVIFTGNLSSGNFVIPANSQRTFVIEINAINNPSITIYG